jgi:N6-adenosine-specific RNA methylase IME4
MIRYGVIVADPPWSYEDKLSMGGTTGIKRSADSKYHVMQLDEICALGELIRPLMAEDCVVAIWCPSTLFFSHGHAVINAWGITPKQLYHWVKTTNDGSRPRPGMGRMFRNATESAIIGVRGKPKCLNKSQLNVSHHRWLGHSAKPDDLQNQLEQMFEGPRLELFARRAIAGWTCVGDECPGTIGVDVRDWLVKATQSECVVCGPTTCYHEGVMVGGR